MHGGIQAWERMTYLGRGPNASGRIVYTATLPLRPQTYHDPTRLDTGETRSAHGYHHLLRLFKAS